MALILVGTAAYAAYCVMSENEHPLDPEIPPLETLKSVSFLPLELALGLMEAPIHTISFFEGNYKEVAETLEQRIKDILFVNPWLGGWLCNENKELKLFFDDTSVKRAPGTFTLYEPGQISLTSDTAYIEYERILSNTNIKVPKNQNLLGKNEALWRISIIPDAVAPEERFALVASMSHIAGDACVFYKLYDMLSPKAEIVALNPERKQEVTDQVAQKMGAQEMTYATKAISNPLWDFTQGDTDPVQSSIFYVSDEWLERQIRQLRGQVQDVSENDAGNYQVSIPYTEYDYASPELIEKSNTTLRRCGEYSLAALPGGSWNSTYSVMTNWSSFYTDPVSFGDGLKEVLHLPLYSTVELKDIPSKLSLFCVFTASQQKDDESHKRRIGASIVAPRSIVQAVEASGIVDEPISKC